MRLLARSNLAKGMGKCCQGIGDSRRKITRGMVEGVGSGLARIILPGFPRLDVGIIGRWTVPKKGVQHSYGWMRTKCKMEPQYCCCGESRNRMRETTRVG